jgi:Alpha-glutamyl/putrescinyl thymine pyrophosphorylase clade 3
VIRPNEYDEFNRYVATLEGHAGGHPPLKGVATEVARAALAEQILESKRRIRYIELLREHGQSDIWISRGSFDPIRGALFTASMGDIDEASWLVFLSVHFGKHRRGGWNLVRDIYFAFGEDRRWDWNSTSANPEAFHWWLVANKTKFAQKDTVRQFGNHRKYESLKAESHRGTSKVFASYVSWVGHNRGHSGLIADAMEFAGSDPAALFDYLYESMSAVTSFGRTAKFDYLTMIGKLGLAPIKPGSPYLNGSTGPLRGARLLVDGDANSRSSAKFLEPIIIVLGAALGVGMQEMEDSLCNWQKSQNKFVAFRG